MWAPYFVHVITPTAPSHKLSPVKDLVATVQLIISSALELSSHPHRLLRARDKYRQELIDPDARRTRHKLVAKETQCCHLIGTPSLTGGGLMLPSSLSLGTASWSSTLVSRFKKLHSFTGLPLCPPWCEPLCPLPFPLVLLFWLGELRCGMFSGKGCCEPMEVTPTSEALPALERA